MKMAVLPSSCKIGRIYHLIMEGKEHVLVVL